MDLLRVMFPSIYGTRRFEIIKALEDKEFAPVEGEELFSVFVYISDITDKDGNSYHVQDAVVKSPNNVDFSHELWNKDDLYLVHELTMYGYGSYRSVCETPYYAVLEQFWSFGMNKGEIHVFPNDMKKQRCEISSTIREFHFGYKQLLLLMKLKECKDTLKLIA